MSSAMRKDKKHELTVFVNEDQFQRLKKITDQADILPDDLANRILDLAINLLNIEAIYVVTSLKPQSEIIRAAAEAKVISINSRM